MRRTAVLGLTLSLGLVAGACNSGSSSPSGSGGSGAASQKAPRRDTFAGSLVSATGSYAHDKAAAHVYLHPHGGSDQRRRVGVVFVGTPCRGAQHCLELKGTLQSTMTPSGPRVPDTGRAFALTGTGSLEPLGSVRASGSVRGTGFIRKGSETMTITLRSSSGSLTLRALSPMVKGFTSP